MRPSDLRDNSMDRSTAQSECVELSTGTKISRYTDTSPSLRMGPGRACTPPHAGPGISRRVRCGDARDRRECMSDRHGGPEPARVSDAKLLLAASMRPAPGTVKS